ncbi:hypothetical protein HNQ69_001074 [Bartonella callosciuri]|uniref:Uncharacterized protein n=1 Tax=Bartonella callosciuri TaxID=686223 RepID=A0A840NSA0_9HYPH|nr:hypothetical protein [Bartonella callosciuri]MBB5073941.1 hypothetical protein [Bartonella callosciuri]
MVLSNSEAQFYECDDGEKHKIENKTYHLTSSQGENLVFSPISDVYVGKQGTVVDAYQINVLGDNPERISAYGASMTDGGELILTNSHFKDIPGLRAQDAVISMTDGSIQGSLQAVYALGGKADIALVRINVEIEPGNLNTRSIGIVSGFGAFVRISGSTFNFKESGSFLTRFRGGGIFSITLQ